jgi:NADPH2:quinone reductase
VDDVSACAASGAYQPKIGLTLPLEKIADAHAAQGGRQSRWQNSAVYP